MPSPYFGKKVKTDHPLLKPSRWIKESVSANGAFKPHVHAVGPERESSPKQMSGDRIRVAQEVRAVQAPRWGSLAALPRRAPACVGPLNRNFCRKSSSFSSESPAVAHVWLTAQANFTEEFKVKTGFMGRS